MFRKCFAFSGLQISARSVLAVLAIAAACSLSAYGLTPVVTVTASATTVDGADKVTLSAVVTNDTGTDGVTWMVTGGGALSLTTTTSATYTAPTASSSPLSVTVTATSVADPSVTGTATLTVPAAPKVTTTSLASGAVGTAYSQTLTASGGIAPYTFSLVSGTLPTCIKLSTAGVISGTPTASCAGLIPLTFKVTDSGKSTALTATSASINLVIHAATAIKLPLPATLEAGTFNVVYTGKTTATGGAGTLTYSLTAGAVPTSLTFHTSTGQFTGAPTAVGTFDFTVKAADAFGDSASQAYSIVVSYATLKITAVTMPISYMGTPFAKYLVATGGTGAGQSWTLTGGTELPAGLTMNSAGQITGTPAGPVGKTTFTVMVTDSGSFTASATFSISVFATLKITNGTPLVAGTVGVSYSKQMTATGGYGSYKWSTDSAGTTALASVNLAISTTGLISGTPEAPAAITFTIIVTDANHHAQSNIFMLTVADALVVSTLTLPDATTGSAYSQTLAASGGSGTGNTWTATSSNLSTYGLKLSTAGLVSGTPSVTGTASFTANVKDSLGQTATQALTINVDTRLALPAPNPGTLGSATENVLYAGSITATGGVSPYTWTVNSLSVPTNGSLVGLSNGLSANNIGTSTLAVSGTPTTGASVTIIAKITDSASNTATQTYVIAVSSALSITTTSLPAATTGSLYSQTLAATGGTGTGYTWTATSSNLSTYGLSLSTAGVLSGTPGTTGTASFTANVTDSGSHTATQPLTVTVNAPLSLPGINPGSLPSATANQSYTGSITVTGGVSPYAWTVAGHVIPTNGTAVAISDGITVSNNGSDILTVAGTPTTAETVTLATSVTDSASHTAGPVSYTIAVNGAGSSLTGQVFLSSGCSNGSNIPPITITISTTPVQHTTSASDGTFTFSGLPSGTFTLTPSISGPTYVFYPATQSVTLSGSPVSGKNFSVSLGYTVSGNVTYAGAKTGQTYVVLQSSCGGNSGNGTSMTEATLTSGGAYTIRGVPPGGYTLIGGMDALGQGETNDTSPTGSASLTVTDANVTGADVALLDPSVTTPSSGPQIGSVTPTNLGVVITYNALRDSDGIEEVSGYTVQWSTSSTFATTTSKSFPAVGKNAPFWILNNGITGLAGDFANGTSYYFRARGELSNATVHTPWTVWGGGTPTAVTVNPPSSSGMYTVTGTATIPSTVTPTGPLYVGLFNQDTGLSYSTSIASPSNSTPNAYTIYVPNSSATYIAFVILDQNNNGVIDLGDITNINDSSNSSSPTVTISGNTSGVDQTLPSVASVANTTTQFLNIINSGGTSTSYDISFDVRGQNKLPVAVALTSASNHNVIYPVDIGACLSGCGHAQWDYNAGIATAVPNVGDTYTFSVTYSDGTTGTVVGTVSAVLTASNLPSNLQPNGTDSTSVTPTFTWTDPASASSYVYSFYLCCGTNGDIWQIPGNNSQLNGFASTITSIVWGTDPTGDSSNIPSVGDLTPGTTYSWTIQLQDSNGNEAVTQVNYTP